MNLGVEVLLGSHHVNILILSYPQLIALMPMTQTLQTVDTTQGCLHTSRLPRSRHPHPPIPYISSYFPQSISTCPSTHFFSLSRLTT